MTLEEKAKAYDEAIEKARQLCACPTTKPFISDLKDIFPKLKESEDERIRSALLRGFNSMYANQAVPTFAGVHIKDILTWLEKQGMPAKYHDICDTCVRQPTCQSDCFLQQSEQKPTDKVEPKFKIGQTIKKEGFNTGFTIASIINGFYYNDEGDYFPFTDQDNWELVEQKPVEWSEEDRIKCNGTIHLLENLIREGYFDSDDIQVASDLKFACKGLINWLKSLKDRVKQEWSKEDRRHIEKLILNVNAKEFPDEVDWLISLHEKIAPPYWDKEDEEMLNQAIQEVEYALNDKSIAFSGREPVLLWLKHLRPQSQWKPSEEQMDALRYVTNFDYGGHKATLVSLYEQLKKLREG